MNIYRGSTREIPIRVQNIDFDTISKIWVSFCQKKYREKIEILNKEPSPSEVVDDTITVFLTQEDTLLFEPKLPTFLQLRFLTTDGKAIPSPWKAINIIDAAKEGEIE